MSNELLIEGTSAQSVWQALFSIIDRPHKTFAGLVANSRYKWVLPWVLSFVVLLITAWITAPYASELARELAERQWQAMDLPPEQIETIREQSERFSSPLVTGLQSAIIAPIGLTILWLVMTTLFYFTSLVAGADLKFSGVFVVVAWSALPLTLRTLIQSIYIGITGAFPVYPGLAALQVSGDTMADTSNPLIALLSFVDPFWIWHFVLLIIGLSAVTKFSWLKSFFIALIYAVLAIGVSVGLTFIGQIFEFGG